MLRVSLTFGVLVLVGLTSSFEYGGYPGCFNPYVPPGTFPSPPLGPTLGPVPPPIGIAAPTGFGVGPPPVPFTPSPFGCGPSPYGYGYGYGYGYPYGYPGYANCGACGNGVLCGGCGACGTCGGGCNCGFPYGNCGGSCPFNNCGCGNCGPNSFGSCSACNSCPIPNTYIPGYFLEDPTSCQKYLVPPVLIAGAGCCNSFCGTGGTCNSITDGVQTTGSCGATTVSVSGTVDSTTVSDGTVDGTEDGTVAGAVVGTGAGTVDDIVSGSDAGSDVVIDSTSSITPDLSEDTAGLITDDTSGNDIGPNIDGSSSKLDAGILPSLASRTITLEVESDPLDIYADLLPGFNIADLKVEDMPAMADRIDEALKALMTDFPPNVSGSENNVS